MGAFAILASPYGRGGTPYGVTERASKNIILFPILWRQTLAIDLLLCYNILAT